MIYTLSHELTHVMRARASAEYQALQDFIVDYYFQQEGVTGFEDRVGVLMATEDISRDGGCGDRAGGV